MKLVAASQRIDFLRKRDETRDALDQRLIDFLCQLGFLTVPVPNSLIRNPSNDHLIQWIGIVKPSAIVLSGGNNIGEFNLRDQTEAQLIKYAKHKGLPLLGICRGMQMLAHFHGSVIQPLKGHVGTRHNLEGEVNWSVNSFHDLAVRNCPSDFKVFAHSSDDGCIEGIKHDSLPWEGWMWHPEREGLFCIEQLKRAKNLLST